MILNELVKLISVKNKLNVKWFMFLIHSRKSEKSEKNY